MFNISIYLPIFAYLRHVWTVHRAARRWSGDGRGADMIGRWVGYVTNKINAYIYIYLYTYMSICDSKAWFFSTQNYHLNGNIDDEQPWDLRQPIFRQTQKEWVENADPKQAVGICFGSMGLWRGVSTVPSSAVKSTFVWVNSFFFAWNPAEVWPKSISFERDLESLGWLK